MRRLAAIAVIAVIAVLLAGCGGGGRTCARSGDDAELCLARTAGSYRIEAKGLKPGSEVLTKVKGKPFGRAQRVGDDGRPQGVVGLVGNDFGRVTIEAVAPNGERLHLTVDDD